MRATRAPTAPLLAPLALLALGAGCHSPPASTGSPERIGMSPRLYRVILPVHDVERAARFYGGLFGTDGERVSPGRHYFDLGGTILACYDPAADGDAPADWTHHPNQYVYVAVTDLEDAYRRARELGAAIESEIASMPWGERLFYARDPSGNPICLVDDRTLFTGGSAAAGG